MFGLVHRTILWELLKTTLLALVTISLLMVLMGAMTEAARLGLDPAQVASAIPFLIPPTLPYTIPCCLLFACTVVYGGMSGSNELTALKASGIHIAHALAPALGLALIAGGTCLILVDRVIPASNRKFAEAVMTDLQSNVYAYLQQRGAIAEKGFPYELYVQAVRGERLIYPTIKHRNDDGQNVMLAQAAEGTLQVVRGKEGIEDAKVVIRLIDGAATSDSNSTVHLRDRTFEMPLPKSLHLSESRTESLSFAGCRQQAVKNEREAMGIEAHVACMALDGYLAGDLPYVSEMVVSGSAGTQFFAQKSRSLRAEVHLRSAQAAAALPFVLLGCPVSILLRRRDFLQAFFVCFLPIVLGFYPVMILCFNVFKEGNSSSLLLLWLPATAMTLIAMPLWRRVIRY